MRKVKPRARNTAPMAGFSRRWARLALGAGLLVLLAAGGAVFRIATSDLAPAWIAAVNLDKALGSVLQQAGLSVRAITVTGRAHTGRAELLKALNVSRGSPILSIDLMAAHQRIVALPWVREARISRRLPDTIRLELIERIPVAIWQRGGEMVLVDRDGVSIAARDMREFGQLPLIVGKGAPAGAQQLFAMLASEPRLQQRVAAAIRVGERRWNLRFHDGIDVRLPEQGAEDAWHKLALYEQTKGLLGRDIEIVDLRHPDRVVVRLTQGAVQRITMPGREARAPGKFWQLG